MIKYLSFMLLVALTCACGSTYKQSPRNAELVVEYMGKKVAHSKPKWTNQARLRQMLEKSERKYIIFGADWCESCKFLRKALEQGELLSQVEFLNIDELWVAQVAAFYQIKSVPAMLEINNRGRIVAAKIGPSAIVMHIIINEEKK